MKKFNKSVLLAILPRMATYIPPLSITLLKGCIEKKGYTTQCRDLNIELFSKKTNTTATLYNDQFTKYLSSENAFCKKVWPLVSSSINKWAKEFAESNADVIGLSVMRDNRMITYSFIKRLKELAPEKIVIVGGPTYMSVDICYKAAKNDFIDYVVYGEGEVTFPELLDWLGGDQDMKSLSEIKGILYKHQGKIVQTEERPKLKDLNSIPYPMFNDLYLEMYDQSILPLWGSRGCINKCSFCSEKNFYKHYKFRSGENIYEEIKHHFETTGCNTFSFVDSLINGNMKELNILCDHLIKNFYNTLWWGGNIVIREEMTEQILKKLYKAGCRWLFTGVESGSQNVLKMMNKRFSVETAENVIRNAHEAGIKTGVYWMVGFPTETDEDFKKSIQFIKRNKIILCEVIAGWGCVIDPDTNLSKNPQSYGISWENNDWYSPHLTPEIRTERVKIFRDICHRYNLLGGAPTNIKST